MSVLVADVGGTNTRLAILNRAGELSLPQRFENDKYQGFEQVIEEFGPRDFDSCLIAIAGPVTRDRARLTNRDWSFHRPAIARLLGLPQPENLRLMNDLTALGHALPGLSADQLTDIRPDPNKTTTNGQSLVVGIGTGCNVALVKSVQSGPVVIEAELGHACLPDKVATVLRDVWADTSTQFPTNEDVFSGRGLARLQQLFSAGPMQSGPDILSKYQSDKPSAQTVDLLAGLLGLLTQQLIYTYLPTDGVYFAGGVARGLLGSPAQARFLDTLSGSDGFVDQADLVAVRLINDDAAALNGLARVAKSTGLIA